MAGFGDATAPGGGQAGAPGAEGRVESGDASGTVIAPGVAKSSEFLPSGPRMSARAVTRERAQRASRRSGPPSPRLRRGLAEAHARRRKRGNGAPASDGVSRASAASEPPERPAVAKAPARSRRSASAEAEAGQRGPRERRRLASERSERAAGAARRRQGSGEVSPKRTRGGGSGQRGPRERRRLASERSERAAGAERRNGAPASDGVGGSGGRSPPRLKRGDAGIAATVLATVTSAALNSGEAFAARPPAPLRHSR